MPIQLFKSDKTFVKLYNLKKYTFVDNVTYGDITLYEGKSSKDLIVWFNGGGFHTTDRRTSFGLLNNFMNVSKSEFDIITFDYNTRFKYTVHDSLIKCQKVTAKFLQKKTYDYMHAIGISAGVMLAGAYQTNELNDIANSKMKLDRVHK